MPDKRKSVSMARAARQYKKAHTKPKVDHNGSHYWSDGANPYSIGTSESKLKYKPKARAGVFGGSKDGKGATKRVRKNKA